MKISPTLAARLLTQGEVVGVPTETVYGLAASIAFPSALKKIFKLKGRPQDNPLIVHVADLKQLKGLVTHIPEALAKLKIFFPGPLTVVMPANKKRVPSVVRAGLDSVAVRMPDHQTFLKLLRKTGPLAAPSANLSGKPSPTAASHVEDDLGTDFPVLDGGRCRRGVESTVIRLKKTHWELLRHGALAADVIQKALGDLPQKRNLTKRTISPGQKYRHYAPSARMVLCGSLRELHKNISLKKFDAVLGFSDTKRGLPLISLGVRGDFKANLKQLYAALRVIDTKKYQNVIIDMDFASSGLGATLAERLMKASSRS